MTRIKQLRGSASSISIIFRRLKLVVIFTIHTYVFHSSCWWANNWQLDSIHNALDHYHTHIVLSTSVLTSIRCRLSFHRLVYKWKATEKLFDFRVNAADSFLIQINYYQRKSYIYAMSAVRKRYRHLVIMRLLDNSVQAPGLPGTYNVYTQHTQTRPYFIIWLPWIATNTK